MEVKLQKESIGLFKKIVDTCFNHEETMELIVPDTLPDVLDIVDTGGTVLLRSKEADIGKITVSGIVRTHIIYTPESGRGLRDLLVQIPFTTTIEESETIPSTKLVVKAELAGVDTRVINSRKLIARADVMLTISAYAQDELVVAKGIADDTEIEVLNSNKEINPIVDVKEKTFSFSDELGFSSSKPAIGSILKSSARLSAEDMKAVGSKLIIKGTAYISVIYSSAGTGEVVPNEFTLPFSQIMELSHEGDDMSFNVGLMPTGLYIQDTSEVSTESHGITVEIAAVAQLVVRKKMDIEYMSDAYSTASETNCHKTEYKLGSLVTENSLRDNIRGTISTPNQVRSIVGTSVYPSRVRRDENGFKAAVTAAVVYLTDEGNIMRASERFEMPFDAEIDAENEMVAELNVNEAFASPSAGGIEFRIPVEINIREYENIALSPLTEIELDEEKPKDAKRPSLVLCRVGPNDSLWSLAKRYNSTRDLIRQANMMEDYSDVAQDELLIIAKKR